mmetsp:Transcript_34843/g.78736  ORF Transcript_34843/g.78736 Transcript_34843/m.78736 type:complete len:212 (-) Transcript_34843:412-1047(-)
MSPQGLASSHLGPLGRRSTKGRETRPNGTPASKRCFHRKASGCQIRPGVHQGAIRSRPSSSTSKSPLPANPLCWRVQTFAAVKLKYLGANLRGTRANWSCRPFSMLPLTQTRSAAKLSAGGHGRCQAASKRALTTHRYSAPLRASCCATSRKHEAALPYCRTALRIAARGSSRKVYTPSLAWSASEGFGGSVIGRRGPSRSRVNKTGLKIL